MASIEDLLAQNRTWADDVRARDPEFFPTLARGQQPRVLWIGCSDSRVPPATLLGLGPGDLFVHRNIANVVDPADLSCLAVLQYAIDVLRVSHVIIAGHTQCGGVEASLQDNDLPYADAWLRSVRRVSQEHHAELDGLERRALLYRLCRLNVRRQVLNTCQTTVVERAWRRGQPLSVHGFVYHLEDGRLEDLGLGFDGPEQVAAALQLPAPA